MPPGAGRTQRSPPSSGPHRCRPCAAATVLPGDGHQERRQAPVPPQGVRHTAGALRCRPDVAARRAHCVGPASPSTEARGRRGRVIHRSPFDGTAVMTSTLSFSHAKTVVVGPGLVGMPWRATSRCHASLRHTASEIVVIHAIQRRRMEVEPSPRRVSSAVDRTRSPCGVMLRGGENGACSHSYRGCRCQRDPDCVPTDSREWFQITARSRGAPRRCVNTSRGACAKQPLIASSRRLLLVERAVAAALRFYGSRME